jgi:hypothetical protein
MLHFPLLTESDSSLRPCRIDSNSGWLAGTGRRMSGAEGLGTNEYRFAAENVSV